MALSDTILSFITTSVSVRYWYLTRRAGRFSFTPSSFQNIATAYGDMYAALVADKTSVINTATKLSQSNLDAGVIAHIQDFIVLAQTCDYFSATSGHKAPPSIFEELFALVKNVIVFNSLTSINDYLANNNLLVTQNFVDLCSLEGIKVDPSRVVVPTPVLPVIVAFNISASVLPESGGSVTLVWNTQNAASVTIDNGIGSVQPQGSTILTIPANIVHSAQSSTYTLTAANKAGSISQQVSVTIAASDRIWVGIQSWGGTDNTPVENYSSQLFTLPYVVPYIEAFFSYGDGETRTMQQRAADTAIAIIGVRDKLAAYHPGTTFRWAYWPHRYATDGFAGPNDKLFYHSGDKLANGFNSVFTAQGRELFRSKTREFFSCLKPLLDAAGIPDPIFLDADYEAGIAGPMVTADVKDSLAWHGIIMADPRAKTELIDGVQTYENFTNNLKDLDGVPIPVSELYTQIYDTSLTGSKRANVYSTLTSMVVDYGMWYSLYQPAKEIWPNVLTGNWLTHASTRQNLVHGYRFRESPVDAGANFHGMQIAALYGNSTTDANIWPIGSGFNTFNEQLFRFNINKADFATDKDALARKIHTSYVEYFLKGMDDANPAGDKAISLSWNGTGSWTGAQVYTDAKKFPTDYIGATLDYKSHPEIWDSIIASCRAHNVRVIEIFAQNTNKSACDDIYSVFSTRL